jgi:hypothetical protein
MAHNSRVTGRPGYALANAVPHGARGRHVALQTTDAVP